MVDLARLLRLKPAKATVTEAEARATVLAFRRDFQRCDDTSTGPALTADLVWDEHGRAVWRFTDADWPPGLGLAGVFSTTDVDANTGVLVKAGARLR